MKSLEFVPYGLVIDGSEERARYAHHLQGYLATTLLPIFAGWEGELPSYLQKARLCRTRLPQIAGQSTLTADTARQDLV